MATAYDDFSAYADGALGTVASANWAIQTAGGGDWTSLVTTDVTATGGKTLVVDQTSTGSSGTYMVHNGIGSTAGDIEIVCRLKIAAVPGNAFPIGPALMDAAGAFYAINAEGGTVVVVDRYANTGAAQSEVGRTNFTFTANTYYWFRLGRSGTTIRAKVWSGNPTDEPGSWLISGTDSTLTTVKAGLITWDFNWTPFTYDVVGVGSGTDTAPSIGATIEQEGFLWRDDAGSETGAGSLASQDSNITRVSGINTRLRLLLNATKDPASATYQLDYKLSSDSVYQKVETAGGGSLAFGALGTLTTTGTTAPTVAYPSGITAGQHLLMAIVNRPNASTPTVPAGGWTQLTTTTGGTGSEASGTGTIRVTVFERVADGTETGSVTLAITSGTSCGAGIIRSTRTTGKNWLSATAVGSDNTAGTAWSVTFGSDPGVTSGDLIYVVSGSSEDTAVFASEALSQTGITWGTMTERADQAVTTGNDCKLLISQHDITSGTSSAAATYTATASGTNSANVAGASIMVRLRQTDQPIQLSLSSQFADSDATTAQLAAPSGKSTSDFVAGEMCETSNPAPAIDITLDDYTEVEWCITATAAATNGNVYQFRASSSGSALNTYTVTPQWTIGTASSTSQLRKQRLRLRYYN